MLSKNVQKYLLFCWLVLVVTMFSGLINIVEQNNLELTTQPNIISAFNG